MWVSDVQWSESAIYMHISPPSWDSLPPSYSTSIGHQKVPSWIPCAIQQLLFFITNSTDRICYFASVMAWFSSRNRPLEISFLIEVQLLYSVVFVVHSKVNQPHGHSYPLFLGFPSRLGHHRALRTVSCALQSVLIRYWKLFNLFTYKMHQSKLSRWKNKRHQS